MKIIIILILVSLIVSCNETKTDNDTHTEITEIKYEIKSNDIYDVEGGKITGVFYPASKSVQNVLDKNYPSVNFASLRVLGNITLKKNAKKQVILQRVSESISASSNLKFGKFMDSTAQSISPNDFILCLSKEATMTLILTDTPEKNKFKVSATFVCRQQ